MTKGACDRQGGSFVIGRNFDAVVFELDEVLYPRAQYALGGYRAVAEYLSVAYGASLYDAMAAHGGCGDGFAGVKQAVSSFFSGNSEQALDRCRHVYWSHRPRLTLHDDAALVLAYLRCRGVRLGVISRDAPPVHSAKLAALELEEKVDCTLCAGVPSRSASILGALMLMELAISVPLRRMVYVGATENADFAAASDVGVTVARIDRAGKGTAKLDGLWPGICLSSLAYLPRVLIEHAPSG